MNDEQIEKPTIDLDQWTQGLPDVFEKIATDSWLNACQLRTGQMFVFTGMDYLGDGWVRLNDVTGDNACVDSEDNPLPRLGNFIWDRGVYVRLEDIVWIAENGS